jgi:uncharacterized protein YbjT (DUF2867 family)
VARALIVGCGCRGRELGRHLIADGWQVRGTTRTEDGLDAIEVAGIEAVVADPDRPGTVLDAVGDVAVVLWLLASAQGSAEELASVHGPRLERLIERLVDTPVRGFVYEAGDGLAAEHRASGAGVVCAAGARWRIPFEVVDAPPDPWPPWVEAMAAATARLVGQPG